MKRFYKHFTMDAIWNCLFGLDIDIQHNPSDPYFTMGERFFAEYVDYSLAHYIGSKAYF